VDSLILRFARSVFDVPFVARMRMGSGSVEEASRPYVTRERVRKCCEGGRAGYGRTNGLFGLGIQTRGLFDDGCRRVR
jgi:hypothetical protein